MFSFFTHSRYWYGMSRNTRANNTAFPLSVRTDKPAQIRIQRPKNTTFNTGLHCLPLTYHLISSPKISKIISEDVQEMPSTKRSFLEAPKERKMRNKH